MPDQPHHERIQDAVFRRAVELLDAGDVDALRDHLSRHPGVVHRRVAFEGDDYFREPTLLEFVAENPVRRNSLPPNIVEVGRVSAPRYEPRAAGMTCHKTRRACLRGPLPGQNVFPTLHTW